MSVVHTKKGFGAPTEAPPSATAHYIDQETGDTYIAKGTSSVNDWVLIENGTVARSERQVLTNRLNAMETQVNEVLTRYPRTISTEAPTGVPREGEEWVIV